MHLGNLLRVGAVADLISSVQGRVEIVWQGNVVPSALRNLGTECHVTGDTVRAVLAESSQDAVIDVLRREKLRLISVLPVRTSLEDYFVAQVRPTEQFAGVTA